MTLRPLTPKEFSAAIGGLRSARWVREQCHLWAVRERQNRRRAERGLKPLETVGIPSLTPRPPYMISGATVERFRPSLAPFAVSA